MWLFVNNQLCFGYIQITTLNNKNTFGTPYHCSKYQDGGREALLLEKITAGCKRPLDR